MANARRQKRSSLALSKSVELFSATRIQAEMLNRYKQLFLPLVPYYQQEASHLPNSRLEFGVWNDFMQSLALDDLTTEKIGFVDLTALKKSPKKILKLYIEVIDSGLHFIQNQQNQDEKLKEKHYSNLSRALRNHPIPFQDGKANEQDIYNAQQHLFNKLLAAITHPKFKIKSWKKLITDYLYKKAYAQLDDCLPTCSEELHAHGQALLNEVNNLYNNNSDEIPAAELIRTLNLTTQLITQRKSNNFGNIQLDFHRQAQKVGRLPWGKFLGCMMLGVAGAVVMAASAGVGVVSFGAAAPVSIGGFVLGGSLIAGAAATAVGVVGFSAFLTAGIGFFRCTPKNKVDDKMHAIENVVNREEYMDRNPDTLFTR